MICDIDHIDMVSPVYVSFGDFWSLTENWKICHSKGNDMVSVPCVFFDD